MKHFRRTDRSLTQCSRAAICALAIWAVTIPASGQAPQSGAIDLAPVPNETSSATPQAHSPAQTAPSSSSETAPYTFSAVRSGDGHISLAGQVPAEATLRYFETITGGDTQELTVSENAPPDFLLNAFAGLRALLLLSEGQLVLNEGNWSISGTAPNAENQTAALAVLSEESAARGWETTILTPAAQPAAPDQPSVATAPASSAAATSASADISACTKPLAEFSARNEILFRSGGALINETSRAALDELAADLAECPDAVVHIEGHTDAQGDQQLNLALSVARAEAVVEGLVSRGVNSARLYAVGYGEANPIADNDTEEGRRQNRRIVVTVSPEHY